MTTEILHRLSTPQHCEQAASVFYAAFSTKLNHIELFTQDATQVIRILTASIQPENAVYALHEGQVVGVLGLDAPTGDRFLVFDAATLRREFGLWGALWRRAWQWFAHLGDIVPDTLHVRGIAIHESMRGQGLGTLLLAEAEQRARSLGYSRLSLEVVDTNPHARRLYERLGFQHLRRQHTGRLTAGAGFGYIDHMAKKV